MGQVRGVPHSNNKKHVALAKGKVVGLPSSQNGLKPGSEPSLFQHLPLTPPGDVLPLVHHPCGHLPNSLRS